MAAEKYEVYYVALLVAVVAASAAASFYVYYPLSARISPVAPPIIYVDPGTSNTYVTLGPNATSAFVKAKAQAGTWEVEYNGGFDDNPDGWYFSPGTYLTNAAWYASVSDGSTTRYGVVGIYGYMTGTSDTAYLLQYVTVPNASASYSVEITLFAYSTNGLYIMYYTVGLYDPSSSTTVWQSSGIASSTWRTSTYSVSASLTPGKTYILFFAATPYHISWFGSGTVYYFVDEFRLYATLSNPYYTNTFIDANVTDGQTYEARLVLLSYTYSGTPNASIKLVNMSSYESDPIVISSGSASRTATSWIQAGPAPTGYTSLRFHLDASLNTGGYLNMTLAFQYRLGDGVTVTYPLQLNVTDPPPENVTLPAPPGHRCPCPCCGKRLIGRILAARLRMGLVEPIRLRGGVVHVERPKPVRG